MPTTSAKKKKKPCSETSDSDPASATPYPAYPARELYIFLHDGDPLGMNRTQIGIFKQVYQEGLGCFLECLDGLRLPSIILVQGPVCKCNLADLHSLRLASVPCLPHQRVEKNRGGGTPPSAKRAA